MKNKHVNLCDSVAVALAVFFSLFVSFGSDAVTFLSMLFYCMTAHSALTLKLKLNCQMLTLFDM